MALIDKKLNTSVPFKDISLTFAKHPVTDDIGAYSNEDAIKRSVQNLVQTKLGERFFNPLLGSKVEEQLFELPNAAMAYELEDDIFLLLENFEPRVANAKVQVTYVTNSNDLEIQIKYDIVGLTAARQQIEFILQSTRI